MNKKLSISRHKRGRGFVYERDGQPVDKATLKRIQRLAVPPAWVDVQIAASRSAKILARGTDAAGRTQCIYNPRFRMERDEAKFERITKFSKQLPELRATLRHELRKRDESLPKVAAGVLLLVDAELFRVGQARYAADHETYGVTTLLKSHVTGQATRVHLKFQGKSGAVFERTITASYLVTFIKAMLETPGKRLFRYKKDSESKYRSITSDQLNTHLKKLIGKDFTVKDFRTWGGTVAAVESMVNAQTPPRSTPEKEMRQIAKIKRDAVKHAATALGNTPAIAQSSYIDPRVFNQVNSINDLLRLRRDFEKLGRVEEGNPAEALTLRILEKPMSHD